MGRSCCFRGNPSPTYVNKTQIPHLINSDKRDFSCSIFTGSKSKTNNKIFMDFRGMHISFRIERKKGNGQIWKFHVWFCRPGRRLAWRLLEAETLTNKLYNNTYKGPSSSHTRSGQFTVREYLYFASCDYRKPHLLTDADGVSPPL